MNIRSPDKSRSLSNAWKSFGPTDTAGKAQTSCYRTRICASSSLACSRALFLQRLSIFRPGPLPPTFLDTIVFVPSNAPLLQSVALIGVVVPWGSITLTALHSFHVRHVPNHPTPAPILELLERNPAFHDLEIRLEPNSNTPIAHAEIDEALTILPRLRRLQLAGFNPSLAVSLLSHIQAPICSTFSLFLHNPWPNNVHVTYALQHTLNFIPARVQAHVHETRMTLQRR